MNPTEYDTGSHNSVVGFKHLGIDRRNAMLLSTSRHPADLSVFDLVCMESAGPLREPYEAIELADVLRHVHAEEARSGPHTLYFN